MKASEYASEIVVPTVAEFSRKRWDRRRAYLACLVTYHLADFVAVELGLEEPEPVRKAVGLSDQFRTVEALNIAAKHVFPTKNKRARKIGLRAGLERIWYPSFAGVARAGATFAGDKHGGVKVMFAKRGVDAYVSVCDVLKSFQNAYPDLLADVDWQELAS